MGDPTRQLIIPIEDRRGTDGELLEQIVRIDRAYLQGVMRREAIVRTEGSVAVVTIGRASTMPGTGRSLLDILAQIALA